MLLLQQSRIEVFSCCMFIRDTDMSRFRRRKVGLWKEEQEKKCCQNMNKLKLSSPSSRHSRRSSCCHRLVFVVVVVVVHLGLILGVEAQFEGEEEEAEELEDFGGHRKLTGPISLDVQVTTHSLLAARKPVNLYN